MDILLIHGLGGASGGGLEKAVEHACSAGPHRLIPVRWDSGSLQSDATVASAKFILEVLSDPNPTRGLARALVGITQDSRKQWDSALAATTQARMQVLGAMKSYDHRGQRFSVIGFSLGSRVLLSALTGIAEPLPNLHHIVFAGAAAPAQAYSQMPAWVCNSESDRAIHVWSENDFVLQAMYPLMQGACPAAGRAPVNIPGVKNVNVKVGHLGYSAIAKELLSIAVTD